jgi:hypothetical protein
MTTVGEDSLSRLSEEEQQAILYWTETIGVPVFPADTRRKGLYLKDWSEIDFAKMDYMITVLQSEQARHLKDFILLYWILMAGTLLLNGSVVGITLLKRQGVLE